jgi:hypothetical protein
MATKDENTYWNAVKGRVGELADKVTPKKVPKTAADIAPGMDKLIGKGRASRIDAAVDEAVKGYKKGGLVRRGFGKARGA